jgi:hypothetical protein
MQGVSVKRVDVIELDKLCRRAANDVRRLFERFDPEKSVHVEQSGAVVVESLHVHISPDGDVVVKLDSYDWASVGPDGLLLDALICSLYVSGNEAQLYKPFERLLVVGSNIVWEGAKRPYTAEEFRRTVAQKLAELLLKAAKKLGQA